MKAHWIKFAPGDFLNGVADLDDSLRGAYITVLCLIWDRHGPIPDDEGWLARRNGISRQKWRKVRQQLLELGKIQLTDDGRLTNRRAMLEVERVRGISEKRRAAANERWSGEGEEPDLFEPNSPENRHSGNASASQTGAGRGETGENRRSANASASGGGSRGQHGSAGTSAEKSQVSGEKIGEKRAKSRPTNSANGLNSNGTADASAEIPSRGRARELELDRDSTSTNGPSRARAREDGPGTGGLYDAALACAEAAGMAGRFASRPALVTQSMEIVQGWIAAGVDIQAQAVPWIAEAADAMDEPAHSLAKFSAMIDTKAARAKRQRSKLGRDPVVHDPKPQFEFEDEADAIRPFRAALAKALPHGVYARLCNHVRFAVMDWRSDGDGQYLAVTPRTGGSAWQATDPAEQLETIHGDKLRWIARKVLGSEVVSARKAGTETAAACSSASAKPQ